MPIPKLWILSTLLITGLALGQTPQISGIANAADYGPVAAPGSLISIFGTNLAMSVGGANALPLPTSINQTSVFINNIPAPLTYVSSGQINAQVPYEVPTETGASVIVQVKGATSPTVTLTIAPVAPGIFTQNGSGSGLGAILHANYSLITEASPAQPGETVLVFATGLGATTPPVQTGAGGNGQPTATTPTITIGGAPATVLFAGAAPGFAGLDQLNVTVPSLSSGDQKIIISIGNAKSTPGVLIPIGGGTTQAIQPTYFGLHLAPPYLAGNAPWPSIQFGTIRFLGDNLTWADLEPSQGTFDFTHLDSSIAGANAHGIYDFIETLVKTPAWASSNTTSNACSDYLGRPGGCFPPSDLNPDGTGADQYWKNFVTAVVQHVCASGTCSIQNWEIWNEPNVKNFWQGTTAQLIRMTQDAAQIIKSINPNLTVITPPPAGGGDPSSKAASFMQSFLQGGGAQNVDVIGFHGYLAPSEVEQPSLISGGLRNLTQARSATSTNKPLWDTEGSWGPTVNLPQTNMQVAYVATFYLMQATYVQRAYWYAYDYTDGTLYDSSTHTLLPPGVAYGQVYKWMVGATPTGPCTNTGTVYSCGFTRPGGYQALAVWDSGLTCNNGTCQTNPFTPPAGYVQYRDLGANVNSIQGNQVQISIQPIFLENMNPPQ